MILAYPLMIVFDISTGGNGFGICENLLTCSIPISEGPRLIVLLLSAFFILVFLLRVMMKFINYMNKEKSIL
jgi:hypothetical protein